MSQPQRQIFNSNVTRRQFLKQGLYSGLAASVPGSIWLGGCSKRPSAEMPNIILITVDALRADHLGCYGYPKNTSPNIDRFAQDALLFENCFSHSPATRPSFASIVSGFLPHETRIFENMLLLPREVKTLPEILKQLGYKTTAVVSNYVLRKKQGFEQGFLIYDDIMNDLELVRRCPERIAQHTTDRAIELLKESHKSPLFMWIHYQDPHGPYTPPARFGTLFRISGQKPRNLRLNTSLSGCGGIPSYQQLVPNRDFYFYLSQYDGEIRYQDEHFKRLVHALKQLDLYNSSLIIFSSDHGEGMGEHNYYFAHGENLYSSLIHVPLIIKYGNELVGRRTDFVQHIDIVPTILRILKLEVNPYFRGHDLRHTDMEEKEIFAEMQSPLVPDGVKFSIVLKGLKLIYTPLFEQYELFDLKTDPQELNNIATHDNYRKHVDYLKARLDRIRNEDFLGIRGIKKRLKLTKEETEKLRSLGYVK